ncbi:hypothetical protein [Sandaracinobacteroides hominis]|uniref:hypothetical protein n=1 Tax=Sandaracinobacteroides hominis TaxID=2780086 RepID=UPI0018F69C39|nr:hypothetical protein [Sandaracinobacteroides hominis]
MIVVLGAMLALAGALVLYVEHRPKGRGVAVRRPLVRALGWALLAAALAVLLTHFGPATAIFVFLLLLMLAWMLAPLIATFARPGSGES